MKFKAIVEYEYPMDHKPPVKAEIVLHGDRVITDNIKTIEQEPCEDCISRAEALKHSHIEYDDDGEGHRVVYVEEIKALSPVTPQPKIGEWIYTGDYITEGMLKCSECGFEHDVSERFLYCPNCGIKMEVEE